MIGSGPRLSVIVPALNEAATLAATLAPLQPLRGEGVEILLVDGGSDDDTVAVATPLVDRLFHGTRGRARQMNLGGFAARGRVLLFLHADTLLPPGFDEEIMAGLARSGCAWGRFDVRILGRSPLLGIVAAMMNLRSRWTGIATGDQAIFCTRAAFLRAGGFAPIPLMEDLAFSRAMKPLSPPLCLRAEVRTSGRRWETQGVVRTILRMWALRAAWFFGADPAALARRYGYRIPDPTPQIVVFARAPQPGRAKTRLAARYGADGAAAIARACLLRTLATAAGAAPGRVSLWVEGDIDDFLRETAAQFEVPLARQPEGDLGEKMHAALQRTLACRGPAILIGTDCPAFTPAHLERAMAALAEADVVTVPAEDGGYVLIGARRVDARLFSGIAWSTPEVMRETRERVRALGWRMTELDTLWDVDRPADVERAQALGLLEDLAAPL